MNNFLTKAVLNLKISQGDTVKKSLDKAIENPLKANEEFLLQTLDKNKDTEIGKKFDYATIKSISDFQKRIPLTTYQDYLSYISRMKQGQTNLIAADKVYHWAETSGSISKMKFIPLVKEDYMNFSNFSLSYALSLCNTALHKKWCKTRGLNLIEIGSNKNIKGVPVGSISGKTMERYKKVLNTVFVSPEMVVFPTNALDTQYVNLRYALEENNLSFIIAALMSTPFELMSYLERNWRVIIEDIINGTVSKGIFIPSEEKEILLKNLQPNPKRGKELKYEFLKGFDTPIMPRIWKNLAFVAAIGGGTFELYTEKMRKYLGDIPIYYSVYGASEGLMAASHRLNCDEMILLPNIIFYEFIPVGKENSTPLTIDQVQVGEEYELVITNRSGLVRYCIKDVVKVVGFKGKCPLIKFAYRENQVVNLAGERTNDEMLAFAVGQTAKDLDFNLTDYCVYLEKSDTETRYVMFLEIEDYKRKITTQEIARTLEENLCIVNPLYKNMLDTKQISSLEVKFVKEQTFALYRELMLYKGFSLNQLKPVRLIDTPFREKFFFGLIEQ